MKTSQFGLNVPKSLSLYTVQLWVPVLVRIYCKRKASLMISMGIVECHRNHYCYIPLAELQYLVLSWPVTCAVSGSWLPEQVLGMASVLWSRGMISNTYNVCALQY